MRERDVGINNREGRKFLVTCKQNRVTVGWKKNT